MLKVTEIFKSIQGEGPWMGYEVLFVRLHGCNLACSFCDTKYSRDGEYFELTQAELSKRICDKRPYYVVFTGGEPLLQKDDLLSVVTRLRHDMGCKIAIETNGTIDVDTSVFDMIVVSPKDNNLVPQWCDRKNVYLKFLASDEHDLESIRRTIRLNTFANIVYIMPIGTDRDTVVDKSGMIIEFLNATHVHAALSPRLHVLLGAK